MLYAVLCFVLRFSLVANWRELVRERERQRRRQFRAPGFGMSSQGIVSTSYSLADCWVHVVSTRAFLTVFIQFEKLTSRACAGSGLGSGFRVQGFPFGVHVSDLVHWLVGPGNQLLREGRTLSLFSAT